MLKTINKRNRIFSPDEIRKILHNEPDPKQISISVKRPLPSDVLDNENPEKGLLDEAFINLLNTRFDPLKIPSSSQQAIESLTQSLSLLYRLDS